MSSHDPKRTNHDFAQALTSLVRHAKECGIDTRDRKFMAWLLEVAEAKAEDAATIRHLYNIIHIPKTH